MMHVCLACVTSFSIDVLHIVAMAVMYVGP